MGPVGLNYIGGIRGYTIDNGTPQNEWLSFKSFTVYQYLWGILGHLSDYLYFGQQPNTGVVKPPPVVSKI